jgi:hypothetical protein
MCTQPDYIGGPYRDTFGGHFVSVYGRISVRISKKSGYRDPVIKISLYVYIHIYIYIYIYPGGRYRMNDICRPIGL